ncbi:unnamed protein product [Heterosigma akashiwo]
MAPPKVSESRKSLFVFIFAAFTFILGYVAATQPSGAGWRFFSWHPFLMVAGFIGMMGSSVIIKKRGGYSNTKLHGILSFVGLCLAFGGLYIIYENKERMGKNHITTNHATMGIFTIFAAILPALAGGVFLHPDFGIDKTNRLYRFVHKWASRSIMAAAWITCVTGLMQLTADVKVLGAFVVPLAILAPMTLL